MNSHFYHIYGLVIQSDRPISLLQLIPSEDFVDLKVRWLVKNESSNEIENSWHRIITIDLKLRKGIKFWKQKTIYGFLNKISLDTNRGTVDFVLSEDQNNLDIFYESNDCFSDLDSFFVSSILGVVLRLREVVCLHGSVININGEAIVLLGKKRSGKSTNAAYFSKLGYQILSEDIVVIKKESSIFYVEYGYPKVRLRPEAFDFFVEPELREKCKSVYSDREIKYIDVKCLPSNTKLPLGGIYYLNHSGDNNDQPFIQSVSVSETLLLLQSNTFCSYIITPNLRKKEFFFLANISNCIQFKTLNVVHDFKLIDLQTQLILQNIKKNR